MIFDFDDAIYLHSFFKTKTLTRLADAIIVGSHELKNWAEKYNKNVYVIPTCVKFKNYEKFSKIYSENEKKCVIGWVGGAIDQYDNLKLLVPIFEKLITDRIQIKFLLIGALGSKKVYNLFQSIKGLDVEFIDALNWSDPIAVPSHIQKFDIGVMPLVDTEWNRGKCAFKAIEYMACGVPVVISAIGENNYLVQDGVNGFLAKTTWEYAEKLKKLIFDNNLRRKIGQAGQKRVKEKYSYDSNIKIICSIINSF